jgi:hypothetical protein
LRSWANPWKRRELAQLSQSNCSQQLNGHNHIPSWIQYRDNLTEHFQIGRTAVQSLTREKCWLTLAAVWEYIVRRSSRVHWGSSTLKGHPKWRVLSVMPGLRGSTIQNGAADDIPPRRFWQSSLLKQSIPWRLRHPVRDSNLRTYEIRNTKAGEILLNPWRQ